jgi:hypothetical protein
LEADRADILQKLAALQSEIQLTKDGLTKTSVGKYAGALKTTTPPLMKATIQKEMNNESYNTAVKDYTISLLRRIYRK